MLMQSDYNVICVCDSSVCIKLKYICIFASYLPINKWRASERERKKVKKMTTKQSKRKLNHPGVK